MLVFFDVFGGTHSKKRRAINQECSYKPQWRIFEGDRTQIENQTYYIVFNVEAYDSDGMHPYYRSVVVSAQKTTDGFQITDLICN